MKPFILLLLGLACAPSTFAQGQDSTYKYWMTLGVGIDRDWSSSVSYSFSWGDNFYRVSFLDRGASRWLKPGGLDEDGYLFKAIDFGIGGRIQSGWFRMSEFVGPSFLFGRKQLPGNVDGPFTSVGISLDAEFMFRPADEIGMGVALFGNGNFEKSFMGYNIRISFGNGK